MEKQRKTFLSYSRVNKDFAIRLAKELKAEGFDIWLDQLDIPAGARWDREVERALEDSEIFMIILTPSSIESENVLDEIGYAIDNSKRFLPVLLENCKVPLRLRRFQYVDFTNKSFDDGVNSAKALLRSLIDQLTIPRAQVPAVQVEAGRNTKDERETKAGVDPIALQKAEEERIAKEKAELDRRVKEEAERLFAQKAEAERLAKAKADAERKAKADARRKAREEAGRLAAQKAVEERSAKQKLEEDLAAKANVEKERAAKEEADRLAVQNAEEERLVKLKLEEELAAKAKADKERRSKEEAERLVAQRAEEERLAKQKEETRLANAKAEADQKAKEEADRLAVQKAETVYLAKQRAEKEKLAKAEAERLEAQKAEEARRAEAKAEAERLASLKNAVPNANVPPIRTAVPVKKTTSKGLMIGIFSVAVIVVFAVAGFGLNALVKGMLETATQPSSSTATEAPSGSNLPTVTSVSNEQPVVPTATELVIQHGTLRVNTGTYPETLDPQKSVFSNEFSHLSKIYEGLTKYDANMQTIPAAAQSWEYNTDATQLTFRIRQGLTYSDGNVLNAERFAYSIKRTIDPATASDYASILYEISGASEWNGGDTSAKAMVDTSVIASHDDGSPCTGYNDTNCNTLTLKFSRSTPYFHSVMSMPVAYPAKQENIEAGGVNWWSMTKYQIGNGPWILKSLSPGDRSVLVSNLNYYGGEPYYDIEFTYIEDPESALEAYKNNELDVISSISLDISGLESEHVEYASSCTLGFFFYQGKEPFTDPKVREAFALALDRDAYVSDVTSGIPTLTWIPPGIPGYQENESRWGYDPEAARRALEESSYGSVDRLPAIVLQYPDTALNHPRYEWLAESWLEVFGPNLKLSIEPVSSTSFTTRFNDPSTAPLVYRTGWCLDFPDPYNMFLPWMPGDVYSSRFEYSNAKFNALIAEATTELSRRDELFAQVQDEFISSVPGAIMHNTSNDFLVKPWVKNYEVATFDMNFPGEVSPFSIYIDSSMLP